MRTALVLSIGAAAFAGSGASCADDDLAAQFLSDAPPAWRQLQSRVLNSRFRAQIAFLATASNPKATEAELNFNGAQSRFVCERRYGDRLAIISQNDDYGFTAVQSTENLPRVTNLAAMPDPFLRSLNLGTEVMAPYHFQLIPITDAVADASFRITSIREQKQDAAETVLVDFECDVASDRGPILKGGSIRLSAPPAWIPLSYRVRMDYSDGPAELKGVADFTADSLKFGLPNRFELESVDPMNGDIFRHLRIDYSDFSAGDLVDADARLTARGLPEPAGFSAESAHRVRWLLLFNAIGIGIVVILCGLWMRRRSKRGH